MQRHVFLNFQFNQNAIRGLKITRDFENMILNKKHDTKCKLDAKCATNMTLNKNMTLNVNMTLFAEITVVF